MDAKTAERINALAKSMKDLHLAASMEEAYERAKEVILGTKAEKKSVREMMKEIPKEDLARAKAEAKAEEEAHEKEKLKTEAVHEEIKDIAHHTEDVKEILDAAEEFEEEKPDQD